MCRALYIFFSLVVFFHFVCPTCVLLHVVCILFILTVFPIFKKNGKKTKEKKQFLNDNNNNKWTVYILSIDCIEHVCWLSWLVLAWIVTCFGAWSWICCCCFFLFHIPFVSDSVSMSSCTFVCRMFCLKWAKLKGKKHFELSKCDAMMCIWKEWGKKCVCVWSLFSISLSLTIYLCVFLLFFFVNIHLNHIWMNKTGNMNFKIKNCNKLYRIYLSWIYTPPIRLCLRFRTVLCMSSNTQYCLFSRSLTLARSLAHTRFNVNAALKMNHIDYLII